MNNYCTNCGQKLNVGDIKCSKCNTYVVETAVISERKVFKIVLIITGLFIILSLSIIFGYKIERKVSAEILANKYIRSNYKNAKYDGFLYCYECTSSCDGSCFHSEKIKNCNKYLFKSNSSLEESDILIVSRDNEIEVDTFDVIINKYDLDGSNVRHQNGHRNYLSLSSPDKSNIDVYNALNEILSENNKYNDKSEKFKISIRTNKEIYIEIEQTNNDSNEYLWEFERVSITNPTFEEFERYNNK